MFHHCEWNSEPRNQNQELGTEPGIGTLEEPWNQNPGTRTYPPKYDGSAISLIVRNPGGAAMIFGIELTVIDAVATSP